MGRPFRTIEWWTRSLGLIRKLWLIPGVARFAIYSLMLLVNVVATIRLCLQANRLQYDAGLIYCHLLETECVDVDDIAEISINPKRKSPRPPSS